MTKVTVVSPESKPAIKFTSKPLTKVVRLPWILDGHELKIKQIKNNIEDCPDFTEIGIMGAPSSLIRDIKEYLDKNQIIYRVETNNRIVILEK